MAPKGLPRPHLEDASYSWPVGIKGNTSVYWVCAQFHGAHVEGIPVLWVNNAAMDVIGARIHGVGQAVSSTRTGRMALSIGEIEHLLEEAGCGAACSRSTGL